MVHKLSLSSVWFCCSIPISLMPVLSLTLIFSYENHYFLNLTLFFKSIYVPDSSLLLTNKKSYFIYLFKFKRLILNWSFFLENYSDKLVFLKTIVYIIDTKAFFEGDEERLSFVVRELGSMEHNINDYFLRCTLYMLKSLLVSMSSIELRED